MSSSQADRPFAVEPLFTRDPRHIGEMQILMAMMAIRGIYERYGVKALNHGIGFDTAAIELLLPTYGESLGLKGKICTHWALNPHPTLIPAIESGWVESVHCFGSEVGMEDYIAARPDVFFTGRDGSLRSQPRACASSPGNTACDLFIGSTLADGRRREFVHGHARPPRRLRRRAEHGPRSARPPPLERSVAQAAEATRAERAIARGHKLVVQTAETFKKGGEPTFVDALDAIAVGEQSGMPIAPGHDLRRRRQPRRHRGRHRVSARGRRRRRAARGVAAVAGVTPIGMRADPGEDGGTAAARHRRVSGRPRHPARRGEALAAGGAQYRRSGCVVGRAVRAAGAQFRSW